MNFWSVLLISVVYFYTRAAGSVPQKLPESWKCADPKCSVPISEAKPVLKHYNSLRNLSLRKDQKVIIYGKGSKTYAVEVDGKRGHIPKNVVLETRLFVRDSDLKYIVTSGTKDDPISENRVEINVKSTPETVVEPTIDIVNLKPEMAPVMQGAFLLAGAAADDSGMTSSPKIPDVVPDAVKNARSPAEDEKAPVEVYQPVEVTSDSEIETGLSSDDNVALDVDDDITDGALKAPAESVPKFDTVDNKVEDTMIDSSNDTAKLAILNETAVETPVTKDAANDTAPVEVSGTKDVVKDPNVAEKESVDKIPEEAKAEEAAVGFSGGLFGFGGILEAALDSLEDVKEGEREAGEDVERDEGDVEEEVGDVKEEDETVKKQDGSVKKEDESVKKEDVTVKKEDVTVKKEDESVKKEDESVKKKDVTVKKEDVTVKKEDESVKKEDESVKKEDAAEKGVVDEEVNLTDKEVFEAVKLPVGIEIDVGSEKDVVDNKLEDTFRNLTEEDEKPVEVKATDTAKIVETRVEVTLTEKIVESKLEETEPKKIEESRLKETEPKKIVESVEKVEQQDFKLDSNVSEGIEADNATDVEPSIHEPVVVGRAYEEKISGIPKQEEEVRSRVKRDFMYQHNQYAYNAHPGYQQQQRNHGGRMNEYNTNNYRQYQTEYPNAYAYQQHGNYEGNMHHNMQANMHHHNVYQSTQQPQKVETKPVERSIPVTTTLEPPTTTEEPVVSKKPDYEDVSVEVDDRSEEDVTDSYQKMEEKEQTNTEVPTSSETTKEVHTVSESTTEVPTSSETATISEPEVTDLPEAVHEEGKVEDLPVESTDSPKDEIVVTSEEVTESDGGWFNMKAITDLFSSEKTADVVTDLKSSDEASESILPSSEEEARVTDEKCSTADENCELNKLEEKLLHGDLPSSDPFISETDDLLGALMESLQKTSSGPIFCLIVTACAVVGFSLGYNFIENRKREGELVAKINSLEKENLVEKKEKSQLKDRLQHVSETSTLSSEATHLYLSQIAALTEERDTLIAEKRDLEDQLMETERDLQTATESNLEMNNLLSESLSTPDGSTVLLETVDKLKAKLENQNAEMKELNRLLNEKSEEIDSIRKELKANQEAKKQLQEKLITLKREKDEEMLHLKESNRDLSTQLDDLMESKSLEKLKLSNELSRLQITLTETQTMLGDRNGEIDALKDLISRLKTNLKEDELNSLYDVASVTGKLTQAEAERDCFKEKFLEEEGARKLLEDHVKVISHEVASLKENYEAAEKEKIDALTKVQVLSNYFKEKETQLQKELGLKESMWLQKQSDDNTIYEQMKSLREENERYKTNQSQLHATQTQPITQQQQQNQQALQNGALCVTKKKKKKVKGNLGSSQPTSGLQLESLQKEIRESETDYKSQIAKAEQKSYENWLTSRQYERKMKESQGEATQLRNMLTMIEKNSTNHSTDDLKQSISEVSNGDPSSPPPRFLPPPPTSPPFMMFQPPPPPHHHDFVPPPPLYPPPPEVGGASSSSSARPPTLGRISSPPLPLHDPRFSPPYMFDHPHYHPQHSPSPPPPHRPMPKPPPPPPPSDQKESMSPGYSEHHERPNRRSKR